MVVNGPKRWLFGEKKTFVISLETVETIELDDLKSHQIF